MGTDMRTVGAQPTYTNRDTSPVGRDVGTAVVASGSTAEHDKSATRFVGLNGEQKDFQSLLGGRGFRRPAGIG